MRNLIIFIMITLVLVLNVHAADEPTPVAVEKLSDSVYMLVGKGGNLGFSVGNDGVVVIDDQYADMYSPIREAIAKITDKPIRLVLNTHWHGDHVGSNAQMGSLEQTAAIIVAHNNVRQRLTTDQFIEFFKAEVKAKPRSAWPVVTFTENLDLHFNNDTLAVNHLPHAHTDGDSYVHFVEDNIIHTGDLYFQGRFPFIDTGSNGSISGMIAGVEQILLKANKDTKIIPGHGALSNKAEFEEYLAMLKSVKKTLSILAKTGITVDQAVAKKPLEYLAEKWGGGFINTESMVRLSYPELTKAKHKH